MKVVCAKKYLSTNLKYELMVKYMKPYQSTLMTQQAQ
jgi:hypothetical protein